jgi:hypothetical protein
LKFRVYFASITAPAPSPSPSPSPAKKRIIKIKKQQSI